MSFSFSVLGPLEVRVRGDLIPVNRPMLRRLLGVLLVHDGEPLPKDRLESLVWDGAARVSGAALHTTVSRLRGMLAEIGLPDAVHHTPAGYQLTVADEAVDARQFRSMLERVGPDLDPRTAVDVLARGLSLWRGPVLGDEIRDDPAVARLNAGRIRCARKLADSAIAAGVPQMALEHMETLAALLPFDEPLQAALLRVLGACGRRAEGLRRFVHLRLLLADELGVDPSPELDKAHLELLHADAPDEGLAPHAGPRLLPYDVPDFTGRTAEIERIMTAATGGTVVISAIDGMAGIGKTALAVHAAHKLAEQFPDGQVFINLHAHTPGQRPVEPAAALDSLLRSTGAAPESIPKELEERAARWRTHVFGRRMLVVLDNAASTDQVRPLLPGAPGCLVLVTSRRRLLGLDGAHALSLDVLPTTEAAALLARVVGGRASAEPQAVSDLATLCGNLPLAIRLAAARLLHRPAWTVEDLVGRLRAERGRLAELEADDRSVAAAFALSYSQLGDDQRRMFRLLGLHPGRDIDAAAAAALAGCPPEAAELVLERLLDAHLLQQHHAGRYRFHDLLRAYAGLMAQTEESPADRDAAVNRLLDYYLATSVDAMALFEPAGPWASVEITRPAVRTPTFATHQDASTWLETERANIVAATMACHDTHAWQLAYVVRELYYRRGYHADWVATHEHALRVAEEHGDQRGAAITRVNLGFVYHRTGRVDEAIDCYRTAAAQLSALGYSTGHGSALTWLALIYWSIGRYPEALALCEEALASHQAAGHLAGEGLALYTSGLVESSLRRYTEAEERFQRFLALSRQAGHQYGEALALAALGTVACPLGRLEEALTLLNQSLGFCRALRYRFGEILAVGGLGVAYRSLGRHREAIEHHQEAAVLARELGERDMESKVLNDLGKTLRIVGRREDALTWYHQALAITQETGQRHEEARAHEGIAHLEALRSQHARARKHWRLAYGIYVDLGMPDADRLRGRVEQLTG